MDVTYICWLLPSEWHHMSELLAIVIAILSLLVTVFAVFLSWYTYKKNEKYLRYSFWIDRNFKIANGMGSKKDNEQLKEYISKAFISLIKFTKEFPDPSDWEDIQDYIK